MTKINPTANSMLCVPQGRTCASSSRTRGVSRSAGGGTHGPATSCRRTVSGTGAIATAAPAARHRCHSGASLQSSRRWVTLTCPQAFGLAKECDAGCVPAICTQLHVPIRVQKGAPVDQLRLCSANRVSVFLKPFACLLTASLLWTRRGYNEPAELPLRMWQGFTWLEEKWHVDVSGQSAAAVDMDGWTYAVDFPWLKMPPLPGMGRKCVVQYLLRSLCSYTCVLPVVEYDECRGPQA